ncbi:uncharacterized protein LOC126370667 [Pectinophora gossypiella]|uniref:uncharacterized protein LOC126370667 n=1 Tax=Pectinophora gossypiella TaxID=13191 RepID=UPI00214E83BA|nr:uncharacterized protein LOC126370667 [Pectinophora gossypiella]
MLFIKLGFLMFLYQVNARIPDMGPEKVYFNLEEAEELFKDFIEKFDKYYDKEEYAARLEVFKDNLHDINKRNEEHEAVFGITEFADLTDEEFLNRHTGFKPWSDVNDTEALELDSDLDVPSAWDWRQKGVVGDIKNQGSCSSCWAFSAVAVIESQYAMKHNKLRSLSDQQMVDCFADGGGCKTGSWPHLAFNEAARVGGYMSSADYPYTGQQGKCAFSKDKVVTKVLPGKSSKNNNEEEMKKLVQSFGPISVAVYSSGGGFKAYKKGVATANSLSCSKNNRADHAVAIVGYGVENGVDYWIIKNSYGKKWGEQGFMKLERGKNACQIASYVAYASVP